jgi:PBP1b-binding outer membrane lipoprotein LpoB
MKLASISIVLLFLAVLVFSCKDDGKAREDVVPAQEQTSPSPEVIEEGDKPPAKLKTLPKERKSDQTIKKKKPKSALDTLRPKTA